jgi:hypothetical protein
MAALFFPQQRKRMEKQFALTVVIVIFAFAFVYAIVAFKGQSGTLRASRRR